MRKLKILPFLILFIAVSVNLFSQTGEWYIDKPIKEIRFQGLVNITPQELEGIVSPFIGQRFSDTLFWDLQSKLFALDYFEEFVPNALPGDPDNNSVIIEFTVQERPLVSEIQIAGNSGLKRNDILDVILLKVDDMVNRTKVRLDSEAIKNLYIEKGYPDAQVQGSIEKTEENNRAIILFTIDEGSQTKVKTIRFSGNTFFSESSLKRVMKTKEQSFFTAGVFQESKLQEDITALETYYKDRGYIDARVINITRETEKDETDNRNYLILTIFLEEGNQYTFGGFTFEGNELFTTEKLQGLVRLTPGSILNKTRLETDYARIADAYYNEGYIFNIINLKEHRDDINRTISYTVNIVEKGRAHIENIIITGNTKTEDYVILRELPFQEGDIFSTQKIREGIYNLQNLQYFSNIVLDYPMGSSEGLMDLIINVEEGRTLDLNFGVTFSGTAGDFPVIGFLKLADKNFLGRGQELSVGTNISSTQQDLTFAFQENWILGTRWAGGVDITISHSKVSDIPQDILSPIFYEGIPDPFDGHYVFSKDIKDEDGTVIHSAGDPYPGIPTSSDIEEYELVTDYDYAERVIPPSYLMTYDSYDISLGVNTGYTFHTPAGRIGIGTGARTALKYIDYDPDIFRPVNPTVRDNNMELQPVTRWYGTFSWDTRDLIFNPTQGFYLKNTFTYVGGVFPSTRDFIKNAFKGEVYFTLFDIPAFKDWDFKLVLGLKSSFSMVLPQYYPSDYRDWESPWVSGIRAETTDLLYIDGMMIARGWNRLYDLKVLWDNWIEFKIPLVEQYIWWDFFLSGTAPYEDISELQSLKIDDFLFSFGGGARLAIPQLPIGMYLVKRFKILDGSVAWESRNGSLFPPLNLDFVISFTLDIF